jgi:Fic family protein
MLLLFIAHYIRNVQFIECSLQVPSMNPEDFKNSPAGRLVPTINGAMAFVPHPLPPPALDLARLTVPVANATMALGELSGVGRTLPNPHLLIRPFSRVEAVASSKIEGTVTTLPELLMLEITEDQSKARNYTREVNNYTRALQHGLARLSELPLSKRLLSEVHTVLLEGVAPNRGAHVRPGEFKVDQNWIGGRLIQTARFVPPPRAEAMSAMDELEKYIHDETETLPLIVKLALIHYQFETIHPYPDGNGRVGRLLVPLMLCERRVMSQPLLYLSVYFERNYDRYIDLLFDVSKSGAWEAWIEFFLKGVEESARNAITKANALLDLHQRYMKEIQKARSSALLGRIIDSLFEVPATTIPYVVREIGLSYNAAKNNIRKLAEMGIIAPIEAEGRSQWFYAREIGRIASAPDSQFG